MVSKNHDTTIALRNLPESRSRAIDLAGMLRGTMVESRKIGQQEHFLLMGLLYAFQRYLYGSYSGDTASLLFELSNAKGRGALFLRLNLIASPQIDLCLLDSVRTFRNETSRPTWRSGYLG
jgi:hypothetical protein